ncbi:glutamate cyclase domain-containing protein [Clostridium magnum]|uniref:D-glutamate cyclase-like C-terminal domain-containing protein n=1 Tax=Clostridium magnum DSM 2767 TaxID=1121326 RepID=A0A161YP80_9CLOT|nr:glutamate cyclase domain-containing protein [Clostridium magnum]KZL92572.1 hypothetical protein CLMAG_23860 [Clostridium magnum DSM 2767]SHI81722.1 protein of unknown function [Clostridium magnum DSM 2767]
MGRDISLNKLTTINHFQLHKLGESLDRMISYDLSGRGNILYLYDAARKLQHYPLTTYCAIALKKVIKLRSPVLILTGFPSLTWLTEGLSETDGPVGAAVLARVLEEVFGAIPIIITAKQYIPYASACINAAGLVPTDITTALHSKTSDDNAPVAGIYPFTTDIKIAAEAAKDLISKINPSAVISIELPGPAKDGKSYTFKGREIPSHLFIHGEALFAAAKSKGILTVGFGDGGNELGMGSLASITAKTISKGSLIACVVPADITLVASVSNWGAYGTSAAITALEKKPEVLQKLDIERIIRSCVDTGGLDGNTNRPEYSEDRVPMNLSQAEFSLMQFIVKESTSAWE